MVVIHPAHRRLTELYLTYKKRKWTVEEAKEMLQCLRVNADWVRRLDSLVQLSQHAYEMRDTDWQHEICAQIEKLTSTMDIF